jgi:hypothetical protein
VFRGAKNSSAELPTLSQALVSLRPDVLIAMSIPPVLAMRRSSRSRLLHLLTAEIGTERRNSA